MKLFKSLLFAALVFSLSTSCFANGVDLDGSNDRIEYGDVTNLDGASSATWLMIADLDTLSSEMEAFNKWDEDAGSTQAYLLWIDSSGDDIGACITNTTSNYTCHGSNTSAVSTTGTQCMAWVWGGGTTWNFYVNGIDKGDNSIFDTGTVSTIPNTSQPLYVGIGVQSGFRNPFNGKIYEYSMWDTALSSAQVADYCNAHLQRIALQMSSANLKLYAPIDDVAEGSSANGVTIVDLSSTATNGTGSDGGDGGLVGVGESYSSYP